MTLSNPVRKHYDQSVLRETYRCRECPWRADRLMAALAHAAIAHGWHRGRGGRL